MRKGTAILGVFLCCLVAAPARTHVDSPQSNAHTVVGSAKPVEARIAFAALYGAENPHCCRVLTRSEADLFGLVHQNCGPTCRETGQMRRNAVFQVPEFHSQ